MMIESKHEAHEVEAGEFIPGLDNGYVVDVDENPDVRDEYNVRLGGEDYVLISFHTANGDEAYLLCPRDMPVTVRNG